MHHRSLYQLHIYVILNEYFLLLLYVCGQIEQLKKIVLIALIATVHFKKKNLMFITLKS